MTKVLNIDDLLQAPPAFTIVIGGVEHDAKLPAVEDFLANLRDMEALAAAPDLKEELVVIVRMIVRAFPTLSEAEVLKWPVAAIERLFGVVQNLDGENKVAEDGAEGNEPSAI